MNPKAITLESPSHFLCVWLKSSMLVEESNEQHTEDNELASLGKHQKDLIKWHTRYNESNQIRTIYTGVLRLYLVHIQASPFPHPSGNGEFPLYFRHEAMGL